LNSSYAKILAPQKYKHENVKIKELLAELSVKKLLVKFCTKVIRAAF
jgi:hypothetical protein